MTVGASGSVMVSLYSHIFGSGNGYAGFVSFAMSGANSKAADDSYAIMQRPEITGGSLLGAVGATFLLTGLNPGTTTFKMKYRTYNVGSRFLNRRISVVAL
ncbi:hypothetical protein [Mycolicibacterium aichiense]|uniref:hypothetical protein n=1 Tax=Mycolicibacterium aichiense TaxID=1799 RepID=UPI001C49806D|nr:hypothetical protein [Mycolicibacterium aichiense]